MSVLTEPSTSTASFTNGFRSTIDLNESEVDMDDEEYKLPSFLRSFERNASYLYDQICRIFDGHSSRTLRSTFVATLCLTIILIYVANVCTSRWPDPTAPKPVDTEAYFWSSFDSPITEMFTLIPGNILSPKSWIWSAISTLTFPLIELHWWQVINDVIAIYLSTTLIEPLWGSRELFSFFFIINLSVALLTTAHYIILYSIYGNDKYLYNVRLYGLSAYCAAICVSVKQLLGESVLLSGSLGKFKNNNVPLAALFVSIFLYLVNLIEGSLVLMFLYGLIISWIYLRFIQNHPNGHRGDLSEGFSFASFFPNIIKPIIAIIANTIHRFFVYIHVLPSNGPQYQSVRVLSERLTQEHSIPRPPRPFKHHQSGDYQHLHQQQPTMNV
ncbi:transmembrane protein 115 [Brevipalpus obovatus]|uniref:transmembrane protein 115 n=1 Tax=Brevipalpus obovatus TaxID=246614 RepID=UPI003D9ECBD2